VGLVSRRDSRIACLSAIVWLAFVAAVYLPDLGRGFLRDDFAWIAAGREALLRPSTIVRPTIAGFYRPMVTASFAADYARHGLDPRAYAFTNLFLYAACAVLVFVLLLQLGVNVAAASVAALAWALNPHGINMALLWISGRTSLLLTLFALLATLAFVRGHRIAGILFLVCALASKEEATLLPVVLVVWLLCLNRGTRRSVAFDVAAMGLAVAVYLVVRHRTPAFTFSTAPWFYRPTTDMRLLARNVLEYLDRGATAAALITIAAACIYRRAILLDSPARRLLGCAAAWFVCGYALTVWIPVRSSLYAVFPSVGAAIACGVVIDRLRQSASTSRGDVALASVLASSLLLIPAYWIRNDAWVEPARVSNRIVNVIAADAGALPNRGTIVFEETDRSGAAGFSSAFGGLAGRAVQLLAGDSVDAQIRFASEGARPPDDAIAIAWYRIENGRVSRVR
jgi:hypothetical protein